MLLHVCFKTMIIFNIYIQSYSNVIVNVTGFAKKCLVHTQFQVSLFTTTQQIQQRLTVHAYTIAKASTVCSY